MQGRAGDNTAFAVVLFLFAVETVRQRTRPLSCVGDGDCRYQRDALVCRAEQHIELQSGVLDGAHIERSQLPDAAAVIKQSAIEKIRTGAAGFEGKFAELQNLVADCEVDKFGLIFSHRGTVMDFEGPGAAAPAQFDRK